MTEVPARGRERRGLSWPWIALGLLQGALLLGGLAPVHAFSGRIDVVGVFAALAFLLTGALLGYRSARGTLGEAALGGALLAVASAATLAASPRYSIPAEWLVGAAAGAWLLSMAGGWVGSVLRRAVLSRKKGDRGVSWPWVAVGVVLGVTLNGSAIFVVSALVEAAGFQWSALLLAVTFAGSLVATGLFVGYHAPGHTPKDAAVVALSVVAADAVLVTLVFRAGFPVMALVAVGFVGFVLVLAGGWVGDAVWQWRKATRRR